MDTRKLNKTAKDVWGRVGSAKLKQLKAINMEQEVFKNAPDWAQWFAIDANGDGFWHQEKPVIDGNEWVMPEGYYSVGFFGRFDLNGIDWRETLIERQTEQNFS